ncbi:hypothetical protein EPUS_01862 [Endocarpon pusillum Z07020]|uniref:Uncharacterized protein n=1 Tax=Endocarpon pusillum (strain Z07020 / HMAS-L-300199) TaxID=1263415 RepID=U1GBV1_ENDPU|nr:uncharacterized protein EPUS_01862 [Endocarpon pusillum Z07020]ERF69533.1 hypothetical protein EPUS_01862 [Endocarpon pusillum Z07020]
MACTSSLTIEKAFDKLKGSLSSQDAQDFLNTTLKDVWSAAVVIEQDQAARKAMKNVRRIQPFLNTMESYSRVIEVFCQGYPPMAFVWGPMKLMLQLSSQYIHVFDKLLDTYRDIANVVPRIDRLRAIFGDSDDFRRSLSLVYVDILDFHQRAYKIFRRRSWHLMFAVSWGMFEYRIQAIMNSLEKNTDNVDKEAAALHFEHMKEARERAERDANDYERRRQNAMVHEVLGWLSADEDRQDETLQRLSDSRQPETCDWIKSKPKFQTWCGGDADSRLIWLQGKPGSGKTILSSFIIEHLKCKEQQVTVSYYFCNHRMVDRDTMSNILCTSAVQILRQHPEIVPVVHSEYYEKWSGKASRTMKKMLKDILAGVSCARIVIDGLDECAPEVQKELPKVLADIHETVGKSFKILICSRLVADPKAMILLRGETENAIKLYVKNEVRKLCNDIEFVPDEDAKWIENRLASKADDTIAS